MKKRIASILLAVMMIVTLLPLGLVDTAWAAETQDAQRKAVTERAQAYIAACNSFSAQNGQSIPYWTISDAEFEGYVQTKTRDKAAETSKLKKQVDAGDFMSALTTKTCTGSNGSHQWSKEKYTCRSHYFSGLDNRDGGYSQCQGFANYMAYVLFGEAGTSESNFTKMTQVGYGFDFQPGDVLRVLDSNGKNGHSMVVYEGSGSSAKVIECNWGHSSRGYCNVRWDLTVAQKQKQFPTVETVWRPNASLAVTSGGTDSGGGTTEDVIGSGNCGANGANVTWKLTSDGTLTISGKGKMADYGSGAPWYAQVKKAVIEDGVTSIGNNAFCWCTSLTSVTIPSSVTSIGNSAFYSCDALTSVTIPNGVTTIGDNAFLDCANLTSVTIPNSVTSIGYRTFSCCDALASVTIPNSVTSIGNWAFDFSGTAVNVVSENKNYCSEDGVLYNKQKTVLLYGGACKGTFKIPNSVTSIGDSAFSGCTSLTSVTIPDSVTSIGNGAFFWVGTAVNVASENKNYSSENGVLYNKQKTVLLYGEACKGTFKIPNSVTSIGDSAFSGCTSLTSVTIPDSVTSIGNGAFSSCTGLTAVTIPDSVTGIGDHAFYNCGSLTSVTIPNSVTSIGDSTFSSCDSLTFVTIPDSVTSIGDSAFSGCTSLTSVTIPDSVTSIGNGAFSCTGLTAVTIPDSVTSIGNSAFAGCTGLTSVTLPASVISISKYTFHLCTSLTSVAIPSSVSSIGEYAFFNCDSLTSVTIPKSVTSIANGAFCNCHSLTDVYYTGTASDWAKITVGERNGVLTRVTLHYISAKPVAPTVKIGSSASSGKPVLTWNAVEGATSYRIYRSTAKGSGYSLLGTTTATSYTNTGAKAGTTYYYRVKAVNDAGLSPYSNIVSGQVKSVTPKLSAPVVKIGNSATSGKPMLTWNAVSGATSYKVYRATSQNGTYSLLGTVTTNSYTNTGAKAGTTYWYKVKAVNSAGESAYSNVVRGQVKSTGQTTVTTLTLGHSSASGKPQLTWKAVSGAASYKVYRATTKNGVYSVINTTKALTYTNTGAALGTTYYYKVEALNASGKSMGFSAIVEGKVAPVLAVGYSSVSGKPQLTWKAVPGATEYQVYRSTQQNSGYSKINTTTATSYVNTGAKANTTYYYKIVAVKGTAASDFSNIVHARPGK